MRCRLLRPRCGRSVEGRDGIRGKIRRWARLALLAGAGAAGYMLFESQWLRGREAALHVDGLPAELEGLRVLHISDVHAGQLGMNLRTLRKAVDWAEKRRLDLVVLTGDILGGRLGQAECLDILSRLKAPLGVFAVLGNHEYGLSKNPLTNAPGPIPWERAGITLLRDTCVPIVWPADDPRETTSVTVCGADYITGGHPLLDGIRPDADLAVLLTHLPPDLTDPLAETFQLAFAGHTHGGQIRLPTPWGLRSLHSEGLPYLEGVHRWGRGLLVISAGIGTTFLPFRLFTRPQVVLYRLTLGGSGIHRVSSE